MGEVAEECLHIKIFELKVSQKRFHQGLGNLFHVGEGFVKRGALLWQLCCGSRRLWKVSKTLQKLYASHASLLRGGLKTNKQKLTSLLYRYRLECVLYKRFRFLLEVFVKNLTEFTRD